MSKRKAAEEAREIAKWLAGNPREAGTSGAEKYYRCPVCTGPKTQKPTLYVNWKRGKWVCHRCDVGGSLQGMRTNDTLADALKRFTRRLEAGTCDRTVSPEKPGNEGSDRALPSLHEVEPEQLESGYVYDPQPHVITPMWELGFEPIERGDRAWEYLVGRGYAWSEWIIWQPHVCRRPGWQTFVWTDGEREQEARARWEGMVIFPFHESRERGKLNGWQARDMDPASTQRWHTAKGTPRRHMLAGARNYETGAENGQIIVVVESITSAMPYATAAPDAYTVATLGKGISPPQLAWLVQQTETREAQIVLSLDADATPQTARALRQITGARAVQMPTGHDPGSLPRAQLKDMYLKATEQ